MTDFDRVATALHASLRAAHPSVSLDEVKVALRAGLANGPEFDGHQEGYVLYLP